MLIPDLPNIINKLNLSFPSPIQAIQSNFLLQDQNIRVYCKRDDLIHPIIAGNKWRKLAPTIQAIKKQNTQHILSFGGGFSNHLHALGFICHTLGIRLTAIVRGDYSQSLTPTLQDLKTWGTDCHFVNKLEYKERTNLHYLKQLQTQFEPDLIIPEGGSNIDCLQGVASLVDEYNQQLDNISHVVLPVASGGTLAGIISGYAKLHKLSSETNHDRLLQSPAVIGIGVLKGRGYLEDIVTGLLPSTKNASSHQKSMAPEWHIEHNYHHGGYAKSSPELAQFISDFQTATSIPIETVYSAKCFFALKDMIQKQRFAEHSKILIIHTGGLQGNRAATKLNNL